MKKQKVAVLGAPVWQGQVHQGVKLGPDAMRLAGLMKSLRSISPDTVDYGNVAAKNISPVLPVNYHNMKHLETVRYYCELLAKQVSAIAGNGVFPIILGGDHSIAIGSIAGIASHYENLGVIWYDAHADINTPETSPTGNIHGMPLAACMGFGHESLTSIGGYYQKVKPENIVMIGVRDIDPGETELIANHKIKVYSAHDVARLGAEKVIRQTVEYLANKCDGIHLSFDLDALDPQIACGVGTPATGGGWSSKHNGYAGLFIPAQCNYFRRYCGGQSVA